MVVKSVEVLSHEANSNCRCDRDPIRLVLSVFPRGEKDEEVTDTVVAFTCFVVAMMVRAEGWRRHDGTIL